MPFTSDFWDLFCLSSLFLLLPPYGCFSSPLPSLVFPTNTETHTRDSDWSWGHFEVRVRNARVCGRPTSERTLPELWTRWWGMPYLCAFSLDTLFHRYLFTFSASRYGDGGEIPGTGRIHPIYKRSKNLRAMPEHACLYGLRSSLSLVSAVKEEVGREWGLYRRFLIFF